MSSCVAACEYVCGMQKESKPFVSRLALAKLANCMQSWQLVAKEQQSFMHSTSAVSKRSLQGSVQRKTLRVHVHWG